jgi:hypothetical protein
MTRLPIRLSALVAGAALIEAIYTCIVLTGLLLGYPPQGEKAQPWPLPLTAVAFLNTAWLLVASVVSVVVSWRRGPSPQAGRNPATLGALVVRILFMAAPAVAVAILNDWPSIRPSDAGWLFALIFGPALIPPAVAFFVWRGARADRI